MIIKETQLLKENIGIRENIKNKTLFILYKQGRLENKRYFRRCIIFTCSFCSDHEKKQRRIITWTMK